MVNCSVPSCKHDSRKHTKKNSDITFHRFPSDQRRKELWIEAVNRGDEWFPSPRTTICSKHFEQRFIGFSGGKRQLTSEAIPTLYLQDEEIPDRDINPNQLKYFDPNAEKDKGVRHTDILCKNCQNVIVGFRYKCITCEDYDLCKKCEMMETHSEHYVLRIPKPLESREAEEIAQKLQQMFETDEGIPPIDMEEEDPIGISIGECGEDEPIQDDNVDEDIHSMEQLKNITHSEASRVIDKSKDVGEPTGTVRRKRKRTAERETVSDGKRMSDANAKVNATPEIAFADANSDSDSDDSSIEIEIKEEICEGEESEMISRLDVGETVNPYVKENQL